MGVIEEVTIGFVVGLARERGEVEMLAGWSGSAMGEEGAMERWDEDYGRVGSVGYQREGGEGWGEEMDEADEDEDGYGRHHDVGEIEGV